MGDPLFLLVVFNFLFAVNHHGDEGLHGPQENEGQVMGFNIRPETPGLLAVGHDPFGDGHKLLEVFQAGFKVAGGPGNFIDEDMNQVRLILVGVQEIEDDFSKLPVEVLPAFLGLYQ